MKKKKKKIKRNTDTTVCYKLVFHFYIMQCTNNLST